MLLFLVLLFLYYCFIVGSQRRQWHPTPVLLPGKSHGRRSLVGCSPWGREESEHDWATSLLLFTFMHWRRKWQPTPLFLPGESQGWRSLVGCHLWGHRVGHDWSDLAAAAAAVGSNTFNTMLLNKFCKLFRFLFYSCYLLIYLSRKTNKQTPIYFLISSLF